MPGLWHVRGFAALLILAAIASCARVHLDPSSESRSAALQPGSSPSNVVLYWEAPAPGSTNSLGKILLVNSNRASTLLSPSLKAVSGTLVSAGGTWNADGTVLTLRFLLGNRVVLATIRLQPTSSGLSAQIDADQPVIASLEMGPWDASLEATGIPVPYYTGPIWYSRRLGLFLNSWWDWHTTQATRLTETTARYLPKTDGTSNTAHELLVIAVSPDVDAVFPYPGNPPSPYMEEMSGRLVLDIWDAGFQAIERQLAQLGDYGVTDCIAIVHNWQHLGYDNGLPEHYPANELLGGCADLRAVIEQGKKNRCRMALHENYVDYYPNYPGFTSASVALNSDRTPMNSWFNTSTGIQSFSTRPAWMQINAAAQSPPIHGQYGTTAGYLDVHSAASISSHGDMDAQQPGAATLSAWMKANQSLWDYERQTHQGPVLGEGLNHWYYSGQLDGVEAQLGAGSIPLHTDAALPLFVDFDLLRIHPLQVNHGMGYYSRWSSSANLTLTPLQHDAYRMQEVAFGHAPFVDDWGDVGQAMVETHLIAPVAKGYGTAPVASIRYRVNREWRSPSMAAQTGQFAQVEVTYDNGLVVVANSAQEELAWNGLRLPSFGWAAQGKDLLAYSALCGSTLCDYAETPTGVFANARNQQDAHAGWGFAAPAVRSVASAGLRAFDLTLSWDVRLPLPSDIPYKLFTHFVDDSGASSRPPVPFQADRFPSPPTPQWGASQMFTDGPWRISIPSSVPDGTYSMRVGLFDPTTGGRLRLAGNNDGSNRYIVGRIAILDRGRQVQFVPPPADPPDPRLNSAGSILDFGNVKTDGMVTIDQEQGSWVLRPVPRNRSFTVLLRSARFPQPSAVQANGGTAGYVTPIPEGEYWRVPLNGAGTYSWPVE